MEYKGFEIEIVKESYREEVSIKKADKTLYIPVKSVGEACIVVNDFTSLPIKKMPYHFTNEGESQLPAMGAFRLGSMKNLQPFIRFNMEAFAYHVHNSDDIPDKKEFIKECLLEVLTHEFCHSLQEYFDMELSEDVVEGILARYKDSWAAKPSEEEPEEEPMVSASDTIELLKRIRSLDDIEKIRQTIDNIMPTLESWAHKRK